MSATGFACSSPLARGRMALLGILGWAGVPGNGELDGPFDDSGIWIRAGDSGSFTVRFSFSGTHTGGFCTRTVTIDPLLPVSPTTWGRIKALPWDSD